MKAILKWTRGCQGFDTYDIYIYIFIHRNRLSTSNQKKPTLRRPSNFLAKGSHKPCWGKSPCHRQQPSGCSLDFSSCGVWAFPNHFGTVFPCNLWESARKRFSKQKKGPCKRHYPRWSLQERPWMRVNDSEWWWTPLNWTMLNYLELCWTMMNGGERRWTVNGKR